jgi:predicted metal-dependent phosphoesterase TrpH
MRIDLHTHTSPRSPCSSIDPLELIREADRLGLDGICLTEHQVLWPPEEIAKIAELARGAQIGIFRGNEFTTNQGDVLVFGYEQDVKELLTIQELRDRVVAAGGFMIAAHPFRGFKTFGISQLKMNVEQACQWKVFDFVDAIEVRNGKVSDEENEMAARVAARLGLPGTAGSDAHEVREVGKWATDFEREIENEQQLVEELRAGRFSAPPEARRA